MFIMREQMAAPLREGLVGELTSFFSGFAAGVLATCCNTPLDVAKSRIQSEVGDSRRYTGTMQTLASVLQAEGPHALYKGFVAKAWRMGVGSAVQISIYEMVLSLIR